MLPNINKLDTYHKPNYVPCVSKKNISSYKFTSKVASLVQSISVHPNETNYRQNVTEILETYKQRISQSLGF